MVPQRIQLLQVLFIWMISGVKTDGHIAQTLHIKRVKNGSSAFLNCEYSSSQGTIVGTYLRRSFSKPIDLIYFHTKQVTKHKLYEHRLDCKGTVKNFTVTLHHFQESDRDIYYCVFGIRNQTSVNDRIVQETVLVSESRMKDCKADCGETINCREFSYKDPIVIGVIVVATVAIICALVLIFWHARKRCQPEMPTHGRAPNSVYEDMNLIRTQSVGR
ncbi:T-cell antigen CD7-like [Chiloscyllium plagiosum]|uniref:T-cell antigen CD7-like n=1 Tax=Chiloscyllium plagiosum TaxID=36176 RepID=UPI001CB88143|nr:T-cell antigen CD7-like [Chiloscyllium plagiosum]XP_043570561.1 T-cell antigen CD7-like [Chiloscyllium plagiosum]